MSADRNDGRYDVLIDELASDLRPVRRLRAPWLRALIWLGAVALLAAVLAAFSDLTALRHRLDAAPDLWLAVAGSTATAVLAALAAFMLSLPDRNAAWALLPAPAALLWIGASGAGCLRASFAAGLHGVPLAETRDCLVFILAVSVPLTVLMLAMLRRGCPARPGLAAVIAGLAAAAAAATLLNFFHPFDATAVDLGVHAAAVALIVAANRALGGRILARAGIGGGLDKTPA